MKHHNILGLSFLKSATAGIIIALFTVSFAYADPAELPRGKPFQQLQTEVNDLQTQLDQAVLSLQSQIDASNALIDQLFSITGENTSDIENLEAYVEVLQKQLDLLQGNLAKDCGSGYFVQEIKSDGTPVCAKDMGNGFKNITEEVIAPAVPYFPYGIKCPASHPRVVSGGYVETPTTSIVGSTAVPVPDGEDGWLFLLNGVGAVVISATCATN